MLQAPQAIAPTQTPAPATPPTPGPVFAPVFSPTFAPNFAPPVQPPIASGLFMQGPDGNFYPVPQQSAAPMMAFARQPSMFTPGQGPQSPRGLMHQPSMFSPGQMMSTAGAHPGMLMPRQPSMFAAEPTAVASPRVAPRQHSMFYQPPPQTAMQNQAMQDAMQAAMQTAAVTPTPLDAAASVQDAPHMPHMPAQQPPIYDPAQIFAPLPALYDPAQMFGTAAPVYMPSQPSYGAGVDPSTGSWSQLPGPTQVGFKY